MADAPRRRRPIVVALVGGFQWAITGAYLFLVGFLATAWYLSLTRTIVSMDLTRPFVVFVAGAFVAGMLWTRTRAPDPTAHACRIEVILALLVFGFVFPFGVPGLLDALAVSPPVPLFGYGVAYALAPAFAYGLVYGLGVRPFLGSEPGLQE